METHLIARTPTHVASTEIAKTLARWAGMFPFAKEPTDDVAEAWQHACGHLSAESWRAAVEAVERSQDRVKHAPVPAEVLEAAYAYARRRSESEDSAKRRHAPLPGCARDGGLPARVARLLAEQLGGKASLEEYQGAFARLMAEERAQPVVERQPGEEG